MTTTSRTAWWLVLSATATLMVTMGIRQSLGLFVQPIHTGTDLRMTAGKKLSGNAGSNK